MTAAVGAVGPRRSLTPWLALGGLALVGGGIAAFLATREAAPAAPTALATGSAAPGSAAEAPLPAHVTIKLTSEPAGATVYQQLESGAWSEYGKTPLPIVEPGSRDTKRYKIELAGYATQVLNIAMHEDRAVDFALERLAAGVQASAPVEVEVGKPQKPVGARVGEPIKAAGSAATVPAVVRDPPPVPGLIPLKEDITWEQDPKPEPEPKAEPRPLKLPAEPAGTP